MGELLQRLLMSDDDIGVILHTHTVLLLLLLLLLLLQLLMMMRGRDKKLWNGNEHSIAPCRQLYLYIYTVSQKHHSRCKQ